ncbi:hypothetical protein DE146DRAFT_625149 [Phaeosphaeria sp. MPI-PUGE-AT-0046c]|nr:hypothetical protein DE146DRAFT_625149 [Phaeosphaeria sp. MPI-PUGE-AT-0046c]
MPAPLEPLRAIKCTYADCYESFDTEAAMKRHKKYSDEHDYCHKCDVDCATFEDLAYHKITAPDEHGQACRVCGDEFKSISGLKRHIELNHKVDQQLTCIGCHKSFYRACLFVEHLEFGHCDVITASQFQGHIIHKLLLTELLQNNEALARFYEKQAKYEAAMDYEEEGGITLEDEIFDDEELEEVKYKAIKPEDTPLATPASTAVAEPFPALPAQRIGSSPGSLDVSSALGGMSLNSGSGTTTVVGSTIVSSPPPLIFHNIGEPMRQTSTIPGSSTTSSTRQSKVWGSRDGKAASRVLFPEAKPTPAPAEFSIAAYDDRMEQSHGFNIMKTRFWDPTSNDFNPDRFYNAIVNTYSCPFTCEQTFPHPHDLSNHILEVHRITRMKCPMCLKYFKSATALMAHCEARGSRCDINKADDYNLFLDRISGGFLGVEEKIRPDHLNNPSILVTNEDTGRIEPYHPPVAKYLQYMVTKPPDWKEPVHTNTVGGMGGRPSRRLW